MACTASRSCARRSRRGWPTSSRTWCGASGPAISELMGAVTMTDTIARSSSIDRLLDDRTYHIEFNGHLTNHAKHAVVALAGLGASPEKIEAYYACYARLTPYGFGLEAPKPSRHAV